MTRMNTSIIALCVPLMCCVLLVDATVIRFRNRQEAIANNGCDCITTFEFKPICGSDGKSYPNAATLNCANECGKTTIGIRHEGLC